MSRSLSSQFRRRPGITAMPRRPRRRSRLLIPPQYPRAVSECERAARHSACTSQPALGPASRQRRAQNGRDGAVVQFLASVTRPRRLAVVAVVFVLGLVQSGRTEVAVVRVAVTPTRLAFARNTWALLGNR